MLHRDISFIGTPQSTVVLLLSMHLNMNTLPCIKTMKLFLKERQLIKAATNGDISRFQHLPGSSEDNNDGKDVAKSLLDSSVRTDVDASVRDKSGKSLLHLAAREGHRFIAKLLIQNHAADIEAMDKFGWTALHCASQRGHKDVAELLLDNGACVNAKTVKGWTPLHCASGHIDVVELLLHNGADVNAPSSNGQKPLHCASMMGHTDTVEMLLDNGAEVNTKGHGGWSPLQWATRLGHIEIIELLHENDAHGHQ